jgi:hypothetical protein
MALDNEDDTDFVKFWNSVLEPKFTKYRHILQGGLSRHSAAVIPNLPIKKGMSVLDVGCGWGDMSLQVVEMVGSTGRVVGIDCVDAFLEQAREDAAAQGHTNAEFRRGDAEIVLYEPRSSIAAHASGAQARRTDDTYRLASSRRKPGLAGSKGHRPAPSPASGRRRRLVWTRPILNGQSGNDGLNDEKRWL